MQDTTPIIYTETDFASRDLLHPYKDEMVKYYFEKLEQAEGEFSFFYTNSVIKTNILPRINKVLKKSFKINVIDINPNVYVQNNQYCSSYFHHHMYCEPGKGDASMVASLYLDPPEVGGEFQFMPRFIHPETHEDDLKEHTFKVEENKLYLFPSWCMHRPLPQEDETYRICLTFDIYSFDRPLFLPGTPNCVMW